MLAGNVTDKQRVPQSILELLGDRNAAMGIKDTVVRNNDLISSGKLWSFLQRAMYNIAKSGVNPKYPNLRSPKNRSDLMLLNLLIDIVSIPALLNRYRVPMIDPDVR